MTIYGVTRHAITLGSADDRVSEASLMNLSIRDVADGNYGLNLINADRIRATGRNTGTTTLGGCPRIETVAREIHFESDFSII